MRRIVLHSVRIILAVIAFWGEHGFGASTDFVDITIQGRLTDINGATLPDGMYEINADLLNQAGFGILSEVFQVQVTDGLFTLVVGDVPVEAFECPDPANPCLQRIHLTLVDQGNPPLPAVVIAQSGRAAVSSRVNGDIETGPGEIDIPSPTPDPQEVTVKYNQFMMTDEAGNATVTINTQGATPTIAVANPTVTTFRGPTNIKNSLEIDTDNNGVYNVKIGGVGLTEIRDIVRVGANDNLIVNTTTGITYIDPNGAATPGFAGVFTSTTNFLNNNLHVNPGNALFPALYVSANVIDINPGVDANSEMTVSTAQVDVNRPFNVNSDADATSELSVNSAGEMRLDGLFSVDTDSDGVPDVFAVTRNGQPTLEVNGDFTATGTKLFVEPHPTDPALEIAYVSLEGGEAGTYVRGSGVLERGVATIELPEHFRLVTNVEGLTAQITPRGPVQSMLYVASVTPSLLVVKSSDPSDREVAFDYMINGVRRGYEGHEAIRAKQTLAQTGQ